MPDSASLQVKVTVTGSLCQPWAFAGVDCAAVIVGAVLSIETVYWPVAQLPAGSQDWSEVTTWSAPSVLIVEAGGLVGVPEDGRGSTLFQEIVTGPSYQPFTAGRSGVPNTAGG